MQSNIVNLVSLFIALIAVGVAIWQVRASDRSSERSNALPIVSEIMHEWRSTQLRSDVAYILDHTPQGKGEEGFNSLPSRWRDRAYRVCYFFDYVGVLASLGIISDELVISIMGTRIVQVWQKLEPFIGQERQYRAKTYPPGVPPGFLVYFEHIVTRVLDLGGQRAAILIQQRMGLRRLTRPLAAGTRELGQYSVSDVQVGIDERGRLRWPVPISVRGNVTGKMRKRASNI